MRFMIYTVNLMGSKEISNDFYGQGFLYSKAIPLAKIKELKF